MARGLTMLRGGRIRRGVPDGPSDVGSAGSRSTSFMSPPTLERTHRVAPSAADAGSLRGMTHNFETLAIHAGQDPEPVSRNRLHHDGEALIDRVDTGGGRLCRARRGV